MNRMRVGIGAGVIIVLLIVGVYLLAQSSSDNNNNSPPAHKPSTTQSEGSPRKPAEPTNHGKSAPSTTSSTDRSLSNSGPGDTVALFLGASVLGYVFFIRRTCRRAS